MSAFKILTGNPTVKRPSGMPRRRWENNIRIDLKEICMNTRNSLIRLNIGTTGEPLRM